MTVDDKLDLPDPDNIAGLSTLSRSACSIPCPAKGH
jgi:hypothetical protein